MNPTSIKTDKSHILYDADSIGQLSDDFFSPAWWDEQGLLLDTAAGRGTTVFVRHEASTLALRHYHRGGLPARFVRDSYLWLGLEKTRPWREWHLLQELYRRGLPVPRPVAARVSRSGIVYRADIITEVVDAEPLANWLVKKRLPSTLLEGLGACLRRFHQAGVYHADLNACNILLDDGGKVTLIDFDRGELRTPATGWQQSNLARLKRSLEKFRRKERRFSFDDEDWKTLRRGYDEAGSQ
jgi:3-deoxy-D-manno-octulosonic acid kinase